MLGHSSIQITYDIYGGLLDLRDPAVARASKLPHTLLTVPIRASPIAASQRLDGLVRLGCRSVGKVR